MEEMIIRKEKFHDLVERALKEYTVVAPVDNEGVVLFRRITTPSELTLEFSNTKIPAKSILFQQTETLFTFSQRESVTIDVPEDSEKVLLLGIRPCDAQSLAVLDHVFAGELEDPYVKKRENTVLIGLSCLAPEINCFCTSVGGSPFSAEYTDIQLTDIGENYYIEAKTDKGKKVLDGMSDLFRLATEEDTEKKKELEKKALDAMKRRMDTDDIVDRLENMFESSYWRKIALKCLGCAACTYACPTCHCFDMLDEGAVTRGARIRVWDSCMYPEYTKQASGYNPRPERMNRVRNRVYHKFNYYPKNWDIMACVGCGRCISVCPVNIDIIDVINRTSEAKP